MENKEVYEFCAELDENGVYVCAKDVVELSLNENEDVSIKENISSAFKEKHFNNVDEIFKKSYQSNYALRSNEILHDAQNRMWEIQKHMFDRMKKF